MRGAGGVGKRHFAHIIKVPNEVNLSYQKEDSLNGLDFINQAFKKSQR